ncbi:MAG TPA: hypothetical protein VMA36_16485 [Candidatus Limnocylindria bacterium]|nr:hypothetical protein [Candidatus Limnocylindria bacterium]
MSLAAAATGWHSPWAGVGLGVAAGAAWAGGETLGRRAEKEIQARNAANASPQDVDLERDAPDRARGRSHEREPSRAAQPQRTLADAGVQVRPTADVAVQTEPEPDVLREPSVRTVRAEHTASTSERGADFELVKSAVKAYNVATFENELRRAGLSEPNGPHDVEPWAGERRSGTLLPLDERGERHAVSLGRGKFEIVAARDLERFSQQRGAQREPSPQRGR